MTRPTRDGSSRRSRMGSLFRRRAVRPLRDDPDDSEPDIPMVTVSPQLGRQISLQRQTSVPEDSLRYSTSRGNVHFWKNFAYEAEGRPFLCASHDLPPDQVAGVLGHEWHLALPRIALVLLTNVAPLGVALPRRVVDALRRGIIKAANTTEMWILTHGLNVGLAKEVGDAVGAELGRRQAQRCPRHPSRSGATLPPLTLLGVAREDLLVHAELFDGRADVLIENEGNRPEESKYELNPDHSHFIVVRDETVNKTGLNYFLLRLEQHLASLAESPDQGAYPWQHAPLAEDSVPLVSLLVRGGSGCLRLALDHLRRQLPLLVLEGSGGLADLLAFAYRQVQRRGPGVWDAEFVESFLKPELAARLCLLDPTYREKALARNLFRDRLVECVRLACQSDQQAVFMLVDLRSQACDLEKLDEILLKAVFKAQGRAAHSGQRKKDLLLTLDWNCPEVAMTEVFLKDPSCKLQVDWALFEDALVRPGREQFVRMLLDRGFQVHKALTPRRLKRLFQRALHEQFFRSVCWEGMLGRSPTSRLGMAFVEKELGWLLETLTGLPELVDVQELWMNAALGIYTRGPCAAERRALVLLSLWACCSRRPALGRLLWQQCDQPIQLALLVSMAYQRLAGYALQGNTRQELLDTSQEFSAMATGVLDRSYGAATCRAYDVLSEQSVDWGYRTAVDIAVQAQNRSFLAHPCCQRWISNLFMGRISVRDLPWGPLSLPLWLKVILCAFLVFPMFIWVRFKSDPHEMEYKEGKWILFGLLEGHVCNKRTNGRGDCRKGAREAVSTLLRDQELFLPSPPPLWEMVHLMWSAPITKFWTFQIFYIVYLALFSVAVLLPSCGNWYVDLAVCTWTALIALESVRRTYVSHNSFGCMRAPLVLRCVEVVLMVCFVCVYALGRLAGPWPWLSPYSVKVVLCGALLCFYYRQIAIYLPISPTLGPLLYKVRLMVAEDFVNFMRMALLVIISGGIVAHALLYPDYPFNGELLRRTFHRAWFSLFLTPISDLEGDGPLVDPQRRTSPECVPPTDVDHSCPNPGLWPYIFVIQYLVLLKLILLTLLYALFSHTAQKIEPVSDDIWKFQRYQLVVDFMNRLCLPPPLNALSYLLSLFRGLWRLLLHCCRLCARWQDKDDQCLGAELSKTQRMSDVDHSYWRQLAQEYASQTDASRPADAEVQRSDTSRQRRYIAAVGNERPAALRAGLRTEERHVFTARKLVTHSEREPSAAGASAAEGPGSPSGPDAAGPTEEVHPLSRYSPYPGTRVLRFPVPDKYVAWEVLWLEYDPVAYSRPRQDFPMHLQPHVDEDLLSLQMAGADRPVPSLSWNCVFTNAAGVSINRQSWMLDQDGGPVVYKLDVTGVPMNPIGRTGLRGRGALPRWGPNHYVLFIITRWQRAKVHLVGGRGLEIVLMRILRTDQFSLPGDFVPGERKYDMLKLLFKPDDLTSCDAEEDVKLFFQNCCLAEGPESPQGEAEGPRPAPVRCEVTQHGYMDDPMNTDHSWREIELWNVHFSARENLQDRLQGHLLWRLVTEDLFSKLPSGQSVLLHQVTKVLQASIL
ncbi:unnamed protein product [Ixodes hexagonus]